ncbi:hypothetical protein DFH11DRAFT_254526 [Phellopilus nigrolimitatus]|nr:hypothetical protein DFH11DRAFT_254526 [Phellopilus nigrolimitatus]
MVENTRKIRTSALSPKQERKLVEYVETKLLDITRNFKKRSHPSSTLPTLESYLDTTYPILSIILQIPPLAVPQAALRTALLLRLTGEFLGAVPAYPASATPLPALLATLDSLDRGWLAVLRVQAWDTERAEGVDIEIPADSHDVINGRPEVDADADVSLSALNAGGAPPVSQTDRARLRSLIVTGTARLEEWLESLRVESNSGASDAERDDDLASALERLGLQQAFDSVFERTLSEMGEFGGEILSTGGEIGISGC